ncbi:MAG: conjugal transfer protein TraI [Rhodoferax ferrireducens]|uniref:Conjugal transfer protein TraI n=1 Tax=Rhodoferax ferrireducens TaxID=192843 RepID=A0A1W9KQ64_9BURK|nr:MAG: conjugal transfer protein TraI [Rhodoferax ferrireducens]
MIAKQVPMKSIGKSDFGGLVKYLTDEQNKNERVGYVSVTNCQTDNHQVAILEVINTQAQNTRATSDKTYHLIVSFRAGEQLDDATLKAIEARVCEGLGFGEHQRVSAVHHDTDNLHFHIAINKIHPTRYTIHDPYNDHKILGQLCEKLEREFGLEVDNHTAQRTGSENRAADMERHAGVQSLLGWIKRECGDQIKGAQSWAELHTVLRSNGLELQERGNGFVITNGAGLGVKASSVARELSKAKLEQRLGAFEAVQGQGASAAVAQAAQARRTQAPPVAKVGHKPPPRSQNRLHRLSQLEGMQINSGKRYEAQPMRSRINTVELYAKYKNEQTTATATRTVEWAKALERKNRLVESAKRTALLKRTAIKAIKGAGPGKKVMYSSTSKTLKDEIQAINKQYLADRQAIYDKYQRLAWADWLRAKATEGDQEALGALRAREAAQGLKGNTVAGSAGQKAPQGLPEQDSITKKGTIIYRVGPTAVRDDGDKLKVSRGANQDGLQAALRLAMERYGNRITVNGTDAFKEQIAQAAAAAKLPITFADAALERRRQELSQSTTNQENANEHARTRTDAARTTGTGARADRGRADSRRDGGAGLTPTRVHTTRAGRTGPVQFGANGRKPVPGGGLPGKPDIGRVGRKPPPESQNRLRGLSQLGVVQLTNRGQVLLPRDVPGHMEQQGTKPDNGLRRDIFGAGRVTAGQAAADKYIAEREATRLKVFDIPKHSRYNQGNDGAAAFTFAGVRQVEGQALALLKRGDEIKVLPVDEATARRLKRVAVGEAVAVTAKGSIKTKGRSR